MKKTIKFTINYNKNILTLDTGIEQELIPGKDYYLADSSREPTKVRFIDYDINKSINTEFIIVASCKSYFTNTIDYMYPKSLFKTKQQAIDYYINKKIKKST